MRRPVLDTGKYRAAMDSGLLDRRPMFTGSDFQRSTASNTLRSVYRRAWDGIVAAHCRTEPLAA